MTGYMARRQAPDTSGDDDGLIWADLWVNIAFVLFAVVSDPATTWLLQDTRLLTEGTEPATGQVLTLHLVPGPDGVPLLRETTADGRVLDADAATEAVTRALTTDPATTFLLAAAADLPSGTLMDTIADLERSGAGTITIARSVAEGN